MYLDDYYLYGCPRNFSPADWRCIRSARYLARTMRPRDRAMLHEYLGLLYGLFHKWRTLGKSKKSARKLARRVGLSMTKARPAWILVEATFLKAGRKQHSRWARVLEFAYRIKVLPRSFARFVQENGGVSGCAAFAAQRKRPRSRSYARLGGWDGYLTSARTISAIAIYRNRTRRLQFQISSPASPAPLTSFRPAQFRISTASSGTRPARKDLKA
jgi:hypothetical protein